MTSAPSSTSMAPCVVLAPANQALGDRLPTCIAEMGWSSRIEHDARMALAEACLVRRNLRLRHAWDDEVVPLPGLLLVNPEEVEHLDELLAAVHEHVPDLPMWRWDGESILPLEPAREESEPTPDPPIPASLPFRPEPLTHDEVSMLLHGRRDPDTP